MFTNFYYSFLYNLAVKSRYFSNKFSVLFNRLYEKALKEESQNYPILTFVNHQSFTCPFSHKLLFYQKNYPLYDKQLPKLCQYIHNELKRSISIIDVGANVGDTVINIGIKDAFYLCIEGDNLFSQYLSKNLKKYHYSIEKCFLSDINEDRPYQIATSDGTGHLVKSEKSFTKLITLDYLLEEKYPNIIFDLLKIDTDGFDFKVIRGARRSLQKWHPLLFFEWDKAFCAEQGEDPLSIFPLLNEIGYKDCILFDNFGNLFCKVESSENQMLKTYIDNTHGDGLPYYYDVLAIPEKSLFCMNHLFSLFFDGKKHS